MLFDAHAHLAAPDFADDLSDVLTRAESAGLCGVLTVGETLADAERILDLAAGHRLIKPAAGLFPTILDPAAAAAVLAFVRRNADRLVALGEVGLDRWVVKTEAEWRVQEDILAGFVDLADRLDLPLNIHSRSAGRHTIAFLRRCGARRVLMHAFDGRAASAVEGAEAGYAFSIPPPSCGHRRSRSWSGGCSSSASSWRRTRPFWDPIRRPGTSRRTWWWRAERSPSSRGCRRIRLPVSPRTTRAASSPTPSPETESSPQEARDTQGA